MGTSLLAMEQSTEVYHCLGGTPPTLIPSVIPEGATVNSLLQLIFHDVSSHFSFFTAAIPDKATEDRIYAHANSQCSTFPIFRYDVEPIPNSPLDRERVDIIKAFCACGNLALGTLEAMVTGDYQYGAALSAMIEVLCSPQPQRKRR